MKSRSQVQRKLAARDGKTRERSLRERRRKQLFADYQRLMPDVVRDEGESFDAYFARLKAAYEARDDDALQRQQAIDRLGITPERYDQGDDMRLVRGQWRIDDVSTACKRLLSALSDIPDKERQKMLIAAARFTHDWRVAYESGGVSGYREKTDCSGGSSEEASAIVMAAREKVLAAMNYMNSDSAVGVRDMLIYDVAQKDVKGLASVYKNEKSRRVAVGVLILIGLRDLVRFYGG